MTNDVIDNLVEKTNPSVFRGMESFNVQPEQKENT